MTFGLHHTANVSIDILRNNNLMTINQITELGITCNMHKYMLPPSFDHFFQNNLVKTSQNVQEVSLSSILHFVD